MKLLKTTLAMTALALAIGAGSALAASTTKPAAAPAAAADPAAPAADPAAPAADAAAPATSTKAQKDAISKACSAEADKQSLRGKARKKFRADCKKKGATM